MTDGNPKFVLSRAVLGSKAFLDLSSDEYQRIRTAKKVVLEALALEEKYDLIITNYLEFEKTLNDLAAEHMVRHALEYRELNECRLLINQRVQNLLSATRLYLDHGAHHASQLNESVPGLPQQFKTLCATEYDAHPEYRIAEALRNHAQHRGFPIRAFQVGGEWTDRPGRESVNLYRVESRIDVQGMRESGKTKKRVLGDLQRLGEKADARPIFRRYIESLSNIHDGIRKGLKVVVADAETELETAIARFKTAFPEEGSYKGLSAFERDSIGRPVTETPIFKDFVERRRLMVLRNGTLVHLSRRHVTSESQ